MLDRLNAVPPDPILGVIAAHAADNNPRKIDLGVGVYRDEAGNTPILDSVREAERTLINSQESKTYLGPRGVPGFNVAMTNLIFGAGSPTLEDGYSTILPGNMILEIRNRLFELLDSLIHESLLR